MALYPGIAFARLIRFAVLAALGLAIAGSAAFAQDDEDLSDDSAAGKVSLGGVQLQRVPRGKEIVNLILGRESDAPDLRRPSLDETLAGKLEEIAHAAGLSDTQRRKLLLAGRGDIQRFRDRVDELQARYQTIGNTTDIFHDARRLRSDYKQGLFGEHSLFAKASAAILTPEQSARVREIPVLRYRSGVGTAVGMWAIFLELRDEQRARLAALLFQRFPPPRVLAVQNERAFHDLVLVELSRMPAKDLKPLFDRDQWNTLQNCLELAPSALQNLEGQGTILGWDGDPGKTVLR